MLVTHSSKQDKRLPSEEVADAHPSTTHYQVGSTKILTSSKPKPNMKKTGGGASASKVPVSDDISDQVPCGKYQACQVPAHNIRYASYCLTSRRPPHVHS